MLLLFPLIAGAESPWAEHIDAPLQEEGVTGGENPNAPFVSVLPLVLRGETVRIALDESHLHLPDMKRLDILGRILADAEKWFKETLFWVSVDRKEEFADIIPILEREAHFKSVGDGAHRAERYTDIEFVLYPSTQAFRDDRGKDKGVVGAEAHGDIYTPIRIYVGMDADDSTLTHELGHALGFADVYKEGAQKNASPFYRSSERDAASVMETKPIKDIHIRKKEKVFLSYKDIDGFINVLDIWAIRIAKADYGDEWPNFVSERILNGWESIDKDSNEFYLMGSTIEKWQKRREKGSLDPIELRILEEAERNR